MRVVHLDHLNLSVESLADSVSWYGRVFGFELVEAGERDGRPWGVLRAGEAMLCLYERPGRSRADFDELEGSDRHGLRHFALRLRDRSAWEQTVRREGLELGWNSPVRYPHSTSWYVTDPTGYEIEVAAWDGDVVAFG